MACSKKDYIAIAKAIKAQREFLRAFTAGKMGDSALHTLACDLCEHFARGNPRFDRARFLAACE